MCMIRRITSFIRSLRKEKLVPVVMALPESELLAGKTALVTGGTGGIGMAIAKAFAARGCKVIIVGSNERSVQRALKDIQVNETGSICGACLDLTNIQNLPSTVDGILQKHGIKCFDILVNAAGLVAKSSFENMTEAEYDSIMAVNLKATYFASQYISKLMIENNCKGHILNVSSSSALRPAWTPYQISKWGIRGLTMGLADSLIKHGIVVNAIAPGPTATKMMGVNGPEDGIEMDANPSGRMLIPDEIGEFAVNLVCKGGDMIVGDTVYMTGGSGTISLHR